MSDQERIAALEAFIRRLLDPEDFGWAVTPEVRAEAHRLLNPIPPM